MTDFCLNKKLPILSYFEFNKICRICFNPENLRHLQEFKYLMNVFQNITNLQVEELDGLPKNICKQCVEQLEAISNFISLSCYNDSLLKDILKKEIKTEKDIDSPSNDIISIDDKIYRIKIEPEINLGSEYDKIFRIKIEPDFNLGSESSFCIRESDRSELECDSISLKSEEIEYADIIEDVNNAEVIEENDNLTAIIALPLTEDDNKISEINCEESQVIESHNNENDPKSPVKKKRPRYRDCCYFCKSLVSNFARHLFRSHSGESQVQQILLKPVNSRERKHLITSIRKKGNFLNSNFNSLKLVRRNSSQKLGVCEFCLGFYSTKHLRHHRKNCPEKTEEKEKRSFFNCKTHFDKYLLKHIFPVMRHDLTSLIAKKDPLICAFGSRFFETRRFVAGTTRRMRELARFLIEVRKSVPAIQSLSEALAPQYYQNLVDATKMIAQFDPEKQVFKVPTFASSITTSLRHCCDIAIEVSLKNRHQDADAKVQKQSNADESLTNWHAMIRVLEVNWRRDISAYCGTSKDLERSPRMGPRKMITRIRWTTDQQKVVSAFFATHIQSCRPPKRKECEELIARYSELLRNKDWLKIKVFIQNLYTKNKPIIGTDSERRVNSKQHWRKRTGCPYCFQEVTHFPRHIARHHPREIEVTQLQKLPLNDPKRKAIFESMRKKGNFLLHKNDQKCRPVRTESDTDDHYAACDYCLGFYKERNIQRHKQFCKFQQNPTNATSVRENTPSCETNKDFYSSVRLKSEVFPIMKNDEMSEIARNDLFIYNYGAYLLNKGKQRHLKELVAKRMVDLGRLLLVIRESNATTVDSLVDVLKPSCYNLLVTAAKKLTQYEDGSQKVNAEKMAIQIGNSLRQVCTVMKNLIEINENKDLICKNPDDTLRNIFHLKILIRNYWNKEMMMSSPSTQTKEPQLLLLTLDVKNLNDHILLEAQKAAKCIDDNEKMKISFEKLSECILAFTILFNRNRINEVEYLLLSTYMQDSYSLKEKDYLESLTKSEKMQAKHLKKVISYGIGCKPLAILFPENVQWLLNVLIKAREVCVPKTNYYLFPMLGSENRWLSGYRAIQKLVDEAGVVHNELFTSNQMNGHISSILQALNMSEKIVDEFDQFTETSKDQYYDRLTEDVNTLAKVSKVFMAIDNGQDDVYKGKPIEDIEVSDSISDTSSDESEKDESENELDKKKNDLDERRSDLGENQVEVDEQNNEDPDYNATVATNIPRVQKKRWTEEQSTLIKDFFRDCILMKKAPNKRLVEEFLSKNKTLFKDRNWVVVKAYVYNCYRDR